MQNRILRRTHIFPKIQISIIAGHKKIEVTIGINITETGNGLGVHIDSQELIGNKMPIGNLRSPLVFKIEYVSLPGPALSQKQVQVPVAIQIA